MLFKKNDLPNAFFCQNIWSYQKKAVPLHPLLKNEVNRTSQEVKKKSTTRCGSSVG